MCVCGYMYIFYMNAAYNSTTDSTHNDKDYRYRIGPCAWGMATFLSAFVRIVLQQRTSIMHSNCAMATLEEWGPRGNLGILVGGWTGLDIANAKSTGAFLRMGPLGGQMLDPMRAADRDLVLAISANCAEVDLKNTFFHPFSAFSLILRIWSLLGEMLGLGPCRGLHWHGWWIDECDFGLTKANGKDSKPAILARPRPMGPGMGAAMSDQFRQHMEAAGPMASEHLGKTRDRHGFTSFSLLLRFFNTWVCFMSIIAETLSFWSFCHFQNLQTWWNIAWTETWFFRWARTSRISTLG